MSAAEPPHPRPRLRPGVAVTALRDGLHLRGRDASVTLEGSRALPALWELLRERLGHEGGHPLGAQEYLAPGSAPPRLDPADPRVGSALDALTAQLRAHDLLTEHPVGAADPAAWLGSCAPRPARAAAALAAARPVVAAADPEGPLASALISALDRAGAPPEPRRDTGLAADRVVAVAGTPPVAVAVARTAAGGFVTAPAEPERARVDAESIAVRMARDTGAGSGSAGGSTERSDGESDRETDWVREGSAAAVTALLAGAAAQRLLCAVAGLPDPAGPEDDPRLLPGHPAVLVASARPPHASYRPWVSGPAAPASPSPAGDLAGALRRIEALTDPCLGVLDAPLPGGL
ncbi:hypothetical protein AB0D97_36330, partial [Streptomyces roseus]